MRNIFLYNVFLFLRQVLFQHRQALIEQLKVTEDPALVLHLTSVLLFQFSTHCMLHAPGRSVPQIINFLSGKIPEVFLSSLLRGKCLFSMTEHKSCVLYYFCCIRLVPLCFMSNPYFMYRTYNFSDLCCISNLLFQGSVFTIFLIKLKINLLLVL